MAQSMSLSESAIRIKRLNVTLRGGDGGGGSSSRRYLRDLTTPPLTARQETRLRPWYNSLVSSVTEKPPRASVSPAAAAAGSATTTRRLQSVGLYDVTIVTEILLQLIDYPQYATNASSLYQQLRTTLSTQVSSGNFTTIMRALAVQQNVTESLNLVIGTLTFTSLVVEAPATDSSGSSSDNDRLSLSDSALFGVIVGAIVLVMASLVFVCYFGDHCIGPWAEDTSETKAAEKQTMLLRYWSTWRPGRGAVVPITTEVENRLTKVDPLTGQLIVDEEQDNNGDNSDDDRPEHLIFGDDRKKGAVSSSWLPFRQKPTAASSSSWWPFQSPTAARRYRLSTAAAAKEGRVVPMIAQRSLSGLHRARDDENVLLNDDAPVDIPSHHRPSRPAVVDNEDELDTPIVPRILLKSVQHQQRVLDDLEEERDAAADAAVDEEEDDGPEESMSERHPVGPLVTAVSPTSSSTRSTTLNVATRPRSESADVRDAWKHDRERFQELFDDEELGVPSGSATSSPSHTQVSQRKQLVLPHQQPSQEVDPSDEALIGDGATAAGVGGVDGGRDSIDVAEVPLQPLPVSPLASVPEDTVPFASRHETTHTHTHTHTTTPSHVLPLETIGGQAVPDDEDVDAPALNAVADRLFSPSFSYGRHEDSGDDTAASSMNELQPSSSYHRKKSKRKLRRHASGSPSGHRSGTGGGQVSMGSGAVADGEAASVAAAGIVNPANDVTMMTTIPAAGDDVGRQEEPPHGESATATAKKLKKKKSKAKHKKSRRDLRGDGESGAEDDSGMESDASGVWGNSTAASGVLLTSGPSALDAGAVGDTDLAASEEPRRHKKKHRHLREHRRRAEEDDLGIYEDVDLEVVGGEAHVLAMGTGPAPHHPATAAATPTRGIPTVVEEEAGGVIQDDGVAVGVAGGGVVAGGDGVVAGGHGPDDEEEAMHASSSMWSSTEGDGGEGEGEGEHDAEQHHHREKRTKRMKKHKKKKSQERLLKTTTTTTTTESGHTEVDADTETTAPSVVDGHPTVSEMVADMV
eukprot:gene12144-8687_t